MPRERKLALPYLDIIHVNPVKAQTRSLALDLATDRVRQALTVIVNSVRISLCYAGYRINIPIRWIVNDHSLSHVLCLYILQFPLSCVKLQHSVLSVVSLLIALTFYNNKYQQYEQH